MCFVISQCSNNSSWRVKKKGITAVFLLPNLTQQMDKQALYLNFWLISSFNIEKLMKLLGKSNYSLSNAISTYNETKVQILDSLCPLDDEEYLVLVMNWSPWVSFICSFTWKLSEQWSNGLVVQKDDFNMDVNAAVAGWLKLFWPP